MISKDEEEWWTARDKNGRVGQIPVKYTMKISQSNGASSPKPVVSIGVSAGIFHLFFLFVVR